MYSYDRRVAAKALHVKVVGWKGKSFHKKQVAAFSDEIKRISGVYGFSMRNQTVQLVKKALGKLETVAKKHGLRLDAPRNATYGITHFDRS